MTAGTGVMLAALSGAVTPLMAPAQADSLTRNDETIGAADAAAPQLFGRCCAAPARAGLRRT